MCVTRLRFSSLLAFAPIGLALFATPGCHASSGSPTKAGDVDTVLTAAAVPLESYCASVANEACGRAVPCCQTAGLQTDDATCHAVRVAECQKQVDVQTAKGRRYDAQQAGRCLAGGKFFFEGCQAATSPPYYATTIVAEACARIFVGSVGTGGSCTDDADCAPQADARVVCAGAGFGKGKCVSIPRAAAGAACDLSADGKPFVGCAEGLYCGSRPAAGDAGPTGTVCLAPGEAGASCVNNYDARLCADSLHCNASTHVCQAPANDGERCDDISCATGLYCDRSPAGGSRCSGPKPLGGQCSDVPCAAPNFCKYSSAGGSSGPYCVAPLAIGSACSPGDQCAGGGACTSGICASPGKANGEACSWSGQCTSKRCSFSGGTSGTCAPLGGGGPGGGVDYPRGTSDMCRGIVATSVAPSSGSGSSSSGSVPPKP